MQGDRVRVRRKTKGGEAEDSAEEERGGAKGEGGGEEAGIGSPSVTLSSLSPPPPSPFTTLR